MQISINMVLDELADYRPEVLFKDTEDGFFSWLVMFEPGTQPLETNHLYLCQWDSVKEYDLPDSVYILCVAKPGDSVSISAAMRRKRIILIRDCPGIVGVFNKVIRLFNTLREWHMNMHLALIQYNDIDQLFVLSEKIIGNPIVLVDLSFKLIAYTRNIVSDDRVYNDLVTRGYHSSETVDRFTASSTVTKFKTSKQVVITFPYDITKYQTVTKSFEIDGIPCAYMRMICSNKEPTNSMLELFEILSESVDFYLNNYFSKDSISRYMYEYVLVDLIENENIDEPAIEERIKYIGLSCQSDYRLLQLAFEQLENTSLPYVVEQLIGLFPESHPFIYGNYIVMLMNFKSKNNNLEEFRESQFNRLEKFLLRHHAYAGLSNSFSTLYMLKNAYTQALSSIEIGLELQGKKTTYKPRPASDRIFVYSDYYVYHMLSTYAKEVSLSSLCGEPFLELVESDRENGTDLAYLLYVYLQNERKPTDSAKVLHMHRNNVIYHIDRIEKAYGLDLSDPSTRLRLLLSYKVLDLLPGGEKSADTPNEQKKAAEN